MAQRKKATNEAREKRMGRRVLLAYKRVMLTMNERRGRELEWNGGEGRQDISGLSVYRISPYTVVRVVTINESLLF